MCNRYTAPNEVDVERLWHVGARNQPKLWQPSVYPRAQGPFIRRDREDAGYSRELVVGQWALIPWFAKEAKLPYSTNNARSEELAQKASYKHAWSRGQRCVIPAADFDEPCWETGKNVWWRFRRADGLPWGLAGLWNVWTDIRGPSFWTKKSPPKRPVFWSPEGTSSYCRTLPEITQNCRHLPTQRRGIKGGLSDDL